MADTLVETSLDLVRKLAAGGALMLLGAGAVNWFISSEANEYLEQISAAQTMRLRMKHRCVSGGFFLTSSCMGAEGGGKGC